MYLSFLTYIFTNFWLILSTIILAIVYQTYIRYMSYFSKNGIKSIKTWPIIGSMGRVFFKIDSLSTGFQRFYNEYPNEQVIGMYDLLGAPVYIIRDPEMIKQICIKDFDHFINHRVSVDETADSLLSRSLFVMRDNRWREMRSTLSPAFTGSKMRLMLTLINDSTRKNAEYLHKQLGDTAKDFNMKDLFLKFACDTIATSAFGLELNSVKDHDNEFYRMGVQSADFSGLRGLKFICFSSIPKIMKFLRIKFFNTEQSDFFRNLVHTNIRYREEQNIIRHDMINLLIESKKGMLNHSNSQQEDIDAGFATVSESEIGKSSKKIQNFEDDDYVAQSMIFFLAGFQAISGASCFLSHELSINLDIQNRLYEEIQDVNKKLNNQPPTYEDLNKMKYFDMIISEILRRWSLSPANDRYVSKPYTLETTDGRKIHLNVGDSVWLPVYPIHMDQQYYPNPEKFDPERFSDENKSQIPSGAYMPFGIGPRNCIGSRFALMQLKSLFYNLLLNFSLEMCEKTQHPLQLRKGPSIAVESEKGFWTKLVPRK